MALHATSTLFQQQQYRQTALVLGVANHRSIAWSCALSLRRKNYNVIVTYQNDRFTSRVNSLIQQVNEKEEEKGGGGKLYGLKCDVSCEESVRALFEEKIHSLLEKETLSSLPPRLEAMVHSVAYAPSSAMKNNNENNISSSLSSTPSFLNTTLQEYNIAHSISSYSLLLLTKYALPYLSLSSSLPEEDDNSRSPSITSLTYLGSTRAIPNYNIMSSAKSSLESLSRTLAYELGPPPHCIRVNCVSAGPISTLASRGIKGITDMRMDVEEKSMLKRNVTGKEVGDTVAFLSSTEASGITGQTIFVDGGYSMVGGPASSSLSPHDGDDSDGSIIS